MTSKKIIIGQAEEIIFLDDGNVSVVAKVDTGAESSSVWASEIAEDQYGLSFVLFNKHSEHFTGNVLQVKTGEYSQLSVINSFGHKEARYKVTLNVSIHGKNLKAQFTLANRSLMLYPVLIGRELLEDKFIVDVTKGKPFSKAEIELKKKVIEARKAEL